MNDKEEMKFVWSDVWLILSIAITDDGNGATLTSIFSAGDYINHAIFSNSELQLGFAKLSHAGYLREIDGKYFITGEAKAFWDSNKETCNTIEKSKKGFGEFLSTIDFDSQAFGVEDHRWNYSGLTDEMVQQAYKEYKKRIYGVSKPSRNTSNL